MPPCQPDLDAAETTALMALTFLAREPERLGRFMALSGVGPEELRTNARDRGFLAGLLEHLLGDETLLLLFAADAGLPPEKIGAAHRALAGPPATGDFG